MAITWVVAANTTLAHIYALGKTHGELTSIQTLEHPEGRESASDLSFEKPGRSESHAGHASKSFENPDAKVQSNIHFARTIAKSLEAGRVQHEFHHLVLIASPHFYGLLRDELNPHLLPLIQKSIQQDYTNMPARELYAHVIELPE
jgi:protein required for attachment to host cells